VKTHCKIFETERLILREFNLDDASFIVELLNSPNWKKYIGDKNVNSLDDAAKYIQNSLLKSYKENGFGLSRVELRGEGTPIGMCGLIKRETLDGIDISFAFLPEYARKGYGFESAVAMLEYGKSVLKLKRMAAITVGYNLASIGLLKKLGLKFEKMIMIPNDDEELMLFGIDFGDEK